MSRDVLPVETSMESNGLPSPAATAPMNENPCEILLDSTDIFFQSLKLGRVRGVVAISGFPASECLEGPLSQLIRELIDRDVLVAVFGANASSAGIDFLEMTRHAGDGLAELCEFMGMQPVVLVDAEADQSGIVDFYDGLAELAGVPTAELPVAIIAPEGFPPDTGKVGKSFAPDSDPIRTADRLDHHVHDNRIAAQWCDRCGGRFSPFS